MSAQIDVTGSYFPRRGRVMMIGNAKCDVMRTQELVNVVVVPTLVAKLERVRITARQHVEEGRQTLAVLGKLRRKLEQYRSDLGRQRLQPSLHQLYRVRAILVQPLPMGNELRRLHANRKSFGVWSRHAPTAFSEGVR